MSCSISAVDSLDGSPDSATAFMSECSTAAAPSGAATGSAGETVTAAGSPETGTDVTCASTAAGSVSSVCPFRLIVSGAGVAAVAVFPAKPSAPGFSLSENILRPPRGPALLPAKSRGTSQSRGKCKEGNAAAHPGPHRGDDTRPPWLVSMKGGALAYRKPKFKHSRIKASAEENSVPFDHLTNTQPSTFSLSA